MKLLTDILKDTIDVKIYTVDESGNVSDKKIVEITNFFHYGYGVLIQYEEDPSTDEGEIYSDYNEVEQDDYGYWIISDKDGKMNTYMKVITTSNMYKHV